MNLLLQLTPLNTIADIVAEGFIWGFVFCFILWLLFWRSSNTQQPNSSPGSSKPNDEIARLTAENARLTSLLQEKKKTADAAKNTLEESLRSERIYKQKNQELQARLQQANDRFKKLGQPGV